MANAELLEVSRRAVGLLLDIGKREAYLLAPLARPQQRQLVGSLLGPRIHHIVGEVEVLGYLKVQVLVVVGFRYKVSLRQKSFNHGLYLIYITIQRNVHGCPPTAYMQWSSDESK